MSDSFDPYYKWLAIPPEEQPPNHYRLLGLRLYESDRDVIETAADQRMAHLRKYQRGQHGPQSQVLLNEVAHAKICLMDPKKRARYDEQLRREIAEQAVSTASLPTAAELPANDPLAMDLPPDVYATAPSPAYYQAGAPAGAAAQPRWMWPVLIGVAGLALLSVGGLVGFAFMLIFSRPPEPVVVQLDSADADSQDDALDADPPEKQDNADDDRPAVVEAETTRPENSGDDKPSPSTPSPAVPSVKPAPERPAPSTPQDTTPTPAPSGNPFTPNTPANPAPTPGGSDTPVAQEKPGKRKPPSQQEQAPLLPKVAEAFKTLNEIYPEDRSAQIREMLKLADESKNETEKFVMLRLAMEQAVAGEDASLVARAIDALESDYEFDADALRKAKFTEFAKGAASGDAIGSIVPVGRKFVDQAMEDGRFDDALEVINAVYSATQGPTGADHRKEVYDHRKEVVRRHEQWADVQAARDVLAKTPDDPKANLRLGRYLCLEEGNFAAGIPHLAKSDDAALKSAAEGDLAAREDADKQALIDAADAWYDAAKARSANEAFLARAHYWYSAARPRATGLDARKVSARLQEIAKSKPAAKVLQIASRARPKPTEVANNTRPVVRPTPTTPAPRTPEPTPPEPTPPETTRPAAKPPRVASLPRKPVPRPVETRPAGPRPVVKSKGRGWPTATVRTTIEGIGSGSALIDFSRDGSEFAIADKEGRIVVYDAAKGEPKHELLGHEGAIRDLAYSPTEDILFSAGQDGTLRAWNDKGEQQIIANDPKYFSGLAISPDGRDIVTTSFQLNRWDVATHRLQESIDGGGTALDDAHFSPDGKVLAVWGGRGGLQFVGATGDVGKLATLSGKRVRGVGWSDDGSLFAYGSGNDDTMWVVDVKTGQVLSHHKVYNGSPRQIVFLPDNRTLITQNLNQMGIWDGPSGQFWQTISVSGTPAMAVSPDRNSFVTCGRDNALRIWDITWKDVLVEKPVAAEGQGGWALHGVLPGDWQAEIDVTSDGRLAALQRGSVTLFDLEKGEPLQSFQRPMLAYGATAFSPDEKMLAVGAGKAVAVFDVATGELLNQSRDVADSEKMCFTKDGKSLILVGRKSAVKVSIPDFQFERTYDLGQFMNINGLALSPDGKTVAISKSMSRDRKIMFFDTNSGEVVGELPGDMLHAFSPDGKAVASTNGGGGIRDIKTGEKLEPKGINFAARSMAFHPDGTLLATGDSKGVVRLWSRKTGDQVAELKHENAIVQLRFLPDGSGLLAFEMRGDIYLWKKL